MKTYNLMAIITLLVSFLYAETIVNIDMQDAFQGNPGTMVIYDQTKDQTMVYNQKRSEQRFSPFSTFKIPHSLIALETGVVDDVDKKYQWDTLSYQPEDWWPKEWYGGKHNMRTAIKYSVVPFYKTTAGKIGTEKMQDFINKFNYGNKDITSGLKDFWLNGSLKISALEQISFLKMFFSEKTPVEKSVINNVKDILLRKDYGNFQLYAKTGTGSRFENGKNVGARAWFVGAFVKNEQYYYFAFNLDAENFNDAGKVREDITNSLITYLKL